VCGLFGTLVGLPLRVSVTHATQRGRYASAARVGVSGCSERRIFSFKMTLLLGRLAGYAWTTCTLGPASLPVRGFFHLAVVVPVTHVCSRTIDNDQTIDRSSDAGVQPSSRIGAKVSAVADQHHTRPFRALRLVHPEIELLQVHDLP